MTAIWNGLHDDNLKPEEADVIVPGLPFHGAASPGSQ